METLHLLPHQLLDRVPPAVMGHRLTSVQRVELTRGRPATISAGEAEEVLVVCIAGPVTWRQDDAHGVAVEKDFLYLPPGETLTMGGEGAAVMRFGAPCERATSFAHLSFAEADADERHKTYGDTAQGSRRDVWNLLDESFDSQRFLAGICTGRPGGWTAWPPHEHGDKREETYVYFGMGDAFGVQFVYDDGDGMDDPLAVALVRDGHVVAVPRGYHPSAGCPAGPISYAYVMVSLQPDDRDFMDLTIQPRFGSTFE